MEILRTPDERFHGLEGWPYEPRYVTLDGGIRMHYLDEGPSDGPIVLLAHGEPTWGYLYRKMIPGLVDAGRRVLVPDLVGFGRSDKPAERTDYSYRSHVDWTGQWLDAVGARDITLFGQDWGGLIFLVHVGLTPDRFAAVVAANTGISDPDVLALFSPEDLAAVSAPFLRWREQSEAPDLRPSWVVGNPQSALNQTGHVLTDAEQAAYDAPFPDERHMAGVRQFPWLVPLSVDDPAADLLREAWVGLAAFDRPFVTAFAEHEDITRVFEGILQSRVAGAAGQAHRTIPEAGHFLQEQQPGLLVETILSIA